MSPAIPPLPPNSWGLGETPGLSRALIRARDSWRRGAIIDSLSFNLQKRWSYTTCSIVCPQLCDVWSNQRPPYVDKLTYPPPPLSLSLSLSVKKFHSIDKWPMSCERSGTSELPSRRACQGDRLCAGMLTKKANAKHPSAVGPSPLPQPQHNRLGAPKRHSNPKTGHKRRLLCAD